MADPRSSQYQKNLSGWFEAAKTGDIKFTVVHCKQYQGSVLPDTPHLSALHLAAEHGHIGTVKYLLPYEKELKNESGWTALMSAAFAGHDAAAAALAPYQAGRQMTASTYGYPEGATAIEIAASRGNLAVVKILMDFEQERPFLNDVLFAAIDANENNLRAHAADKEMIEDCVGRTPLHYAAISPRDSVSAINILLGKYRGCRDVSGKTPLMLAAEYGRAEAVRVLMETMPEDIGEIIPMNNPNCGEHEGSTALILAADSGHLPCVKYLIDAESRRGSKTGTTAMMFAARRGHAEIVGTLLPFEASMQSTGPLGHAPTKSSALQYATIANKPEVVRLLAPIEHGLRNDAGWSAYNIAVKQGYAECVDVLQVYEDEIEQCIVSALMLDGRNEEFNLVTDKPLTEIVQRLAVTLGVNDTDTFFRAINDIIAQGDAIRELEAMRVETANAIRERDENRAKLEEMQNQLRDMKGHLYDMSELEKKITIVEQQYADKLKDVRAMEEEVEEVKEAARKEVEAARTEVDVINRHVEELENHIETLKNSDDCTLGQLLGAQEKTAKLEEKLRDSERTISELQRDIEVTRQEFDTLSAEHDEAKRLLEDMEEMQKNLMDMQENMERFEAEGITVDRYTQLRTEADVMRDKLFDKSRKLNEANSIISMLIDDVWVCNKRLSDTLKKATEASKGFAEDAPGVGASQHFTMPEIIDEMSNLIRSGSLGRSASAAGDLGMGSDFHGSEFGGISSSYGGMKYGDY